LLLKTRQAAVFGRRVPEYRHKKGRNSTCANFKRLGLAVTMTVNRKEAVIIGRINKMERANRDSCLIVAVRRL